MNILIDATNIISGGGVSHLTELLFAIDDDKLRRNEISKFIVVGIEPILNKLPNHNWLKKISIPKTKDSNFLKRFLWKKQNFKKIITDEEINLIFNPGGSYFGGKLPFVTMCRNMLVFETEEANRFGFSLYRLKFVLLRIFQSISFNKAEGTIFISKYAHDYISRNYNSINIKNWEVIHHGISDRFRNSVKYQRNIEHYTESNPYKILYVSILDVYKHHDKIAEAIVNLKKRDGFNIQFLVVGGKAGGFSNFEKIREGNEKIIKYLGKVPFEEIQNIYKEADLFVYGSTCENMPNILIEAMTSGLPICCSEKQPMPEFLNNAGKYFNVENVESIYECIKEVILDSEMRFNLATKSTTLSTKYSWDKCASETLQFLAKCGQSK
ncbi:glycosyltransferase family 1 protein [Sphingobacterium sp. 1.A.5]|uniref:glycosyltransferase family 4 protein n=1 Tax=Sphingobacterium sp. 1.A.5 TaxID=2044604 RepID=UPI000C0BDC30|nr:glycosyltransferase family 1 protein [Sphingobacterium sp. 1.A.5]